MKKTLLTISSLLLLFSAVHADTINTLDQFTSTSSPVTSITQRTYGKAIKITGLTTGQCLTLTSQGILTTTSCGSGGSVTSVDVSGGTTGLSFSGGPITTSGTITMAGTLGLSNGGTGATSFARNSIITSNAAGTALIATTSQLTVGSILATSTTALSSFATTFYIDPVNGNVGVCSPPNVSYRMDVACPGNVNIRFTTTGGGNTTFVLGGDSFGQLENGSGQFLITNDGAGQPIIFRTDTTERMRLLGTSGNLGINDTSADYRLETVGSNTNGYFGVTNSSDGDIFTINASGLTGVASSTPWGLLSVNANGIGAGRPQLVVGSSTATNFLVTNGGAVGIGSTSPYKTLGVTGGSVFSAPTASTEVARFTTTDSSATNPIVSITNGGNQAYNFTTTALNFTSNKSINWSNSTTNTNTLDTGISRITAGLLKITDGGSTNLRDLRLRDIDSQRTVFAGSIIDLWDGATSFDFIKYGSDPGIAHTGVPNTIGWDGVNQWVYFNSPGSDFTPVLAGSFVLDTSGGQIRDIRTSAEDGGLRIISTADLTTTPGGAAIQVFNNNIGGLSGQLYMDTGANDAAGVHFRSAPSGGTITDRFTIDAFGVGTFNPSGDPLGDFNIRGDTNTKLFFADASADKIGIGTSTPSFLTDFFSTATTTIRIDSNHATRGACLVMKDSDGSGYTYVTANNGVLSASTVACN